MPRRLSAAIVMYGGPEETYRCLQSIEQATLPGSLRLFLVDNASPDGALEELSAMGISQGIGVLAQPENKGFGAGHNTVMPLLESEYHAVINPDIVLEADVLNQMADWMDAHPDVVITIPRLIFPDGRPQHIAKRRPALLPLLSRQLRLPFLKKYENHYLMLDEDLTKSIDVEFCSGSFFLIRTKVFEEIGGFDEGYFMYVEDADITQKALQKGRAVYLPQVEVQHAWHRDAHRRPRQFFWQMRSMLRYFKKWGFKLK